MTQGNWLHKFRRTFSALLAVVMLVALLPVGAINAMAAEAGTTLYLKPNSNWLDDSARFAVYYWNDSGSSDWTDMSAADGNGYYEATIPSGYSNIIFCRMNPGTTANNWDNRWNQTSDLTVPTDGNNCYTVAEGAWDKGSGEWSSYTPDVTLYLKPNSNWTQASARFAAYFFGNGETWVSMTDEDGDGYYEVIAPEGYPNVIFCRMNPSATDNNWDNKWNQTSDLTVPTDGNNCYTVADGTWDGSDNTNWSVYPPTTNDGDNTGTGTPTVDYYLVGYINSADYTGTDHKFVDGKLTATFTADSYVAIKSTSNDNWFMTSGWLGTSATSATLYDSSTIENEDKLFVPGKVEVTFTLVVNENGSLTLSYTTGSSEPETTTDYYLVGYINGKDIGIADDSANLGSYKFVDGKVTVTITETSYVVVKDSKGTQYWAETFCQDTTVTLQTGKSEKMLVPAGELTFTLTVNDDGTLTLSYAVEVDVPEIPEGYNTVTVHFLKPATWGGTVNAWVWDASGALPGYELYNTVWPGSPIPANADKAGWYDLVIGTEEPQAFNFIFNDGSNQTTDLTTGTITAPTELWVVGDTVYTTAPREWTHYTATIHFQKPADWGDTVSAYAWDQDGVTLLGAWPGTVTSPSVNEGWYTTTIHVEIGDELNYIFNNNNNGKQTGDLSAGMLTGNIELWIDGSGTSVAAPDGWVDSGRTVHLPGTIGGNNWNAAGNQMEYDAQRGLYTITFENVTPGTYEYKIAINGGWGENYGANGEANGTNMSVTVPTAQDVTFWYNDSTHRVVCSVSYDIDAVVTLSGTDIAEGTRLTDPDMDGLYSVTVALAAGTYSDLKITYGETKVAFNEFTLSSDKSVTFSFDPATGIASHNGSDVKVVTDNIYYTTKDLNYKYPFGAVAVGKEVTFSIDTGADAVNVVLVVKGLPAVKMEKNGEVVDGVQKWTCTTTFDAIGEYQYYFAISNGSDTVFYCDDNYNNYYKKGDYGTGTVRNMNSIFPYDIVVHTADFETPDWMKDAVIYQIFPDRFFDAQEYNNDDQTSARGTVDYEYVNDWYLLPENPEMADDPNYPTYAFKGDGEWSNEIYGGDLAGITEKIDYLKALGVNVIYLNPVFWSISNHRYDACDYMEIDPILGTLGDFEELVAVAEANDMHIILDGVFNHVSDDSVYFDRYYKFLGTSEKIGAYPYWAYVYDLMNEEGYAQANAEAAAKEYFSENYGITDWSYTEWFAVENVDTVNQDTIGLRAGKAVYSYEGWWGYDSMPVIKSTNGSEYQTGNWAEEIISGNNSVNAYWISKGMDGWRLDVANEVSDETWQNFRDSVKALDSEAVIIGEIWADSTRYLLGDMYDSVMNYVFRDAVAGFARGYLINRDNKAQMWDSDYTAADAITTLEILRERYPKEAFYAMMNLVGSHDTARILSYLDDVEDDRYQKDIENAFPLYESTSDEAKALQYVVAFIQFTYAGAPTIYYGDEIGMVGGDDPDDRRAFEWGKGNQELVEWYAKLAAIRAAYPALRTGSVEAFAPDNDVMGYVRSDEANTLVVMANRAAADQNVAYKGTWVDLITGKTFTDTVTVPAYSGVILVAEDEVNDITVNTADLAPAYDPAYIVGDREEVPPANPTPEDPDDSETPSNPITPVIPVIPSVPSTPGVEDKYPGFVDVANDHWAADEIQWAYEEGYMKGVSATHFAPSDVVTRQQLWTVLARLMGEDPANYSEARDWAMAEEISDGTNPGNPVTRQQLVTMFYRYAVKMGYDVSKTTSFENFTDHEDVDEYAVEAMGWAVANGIINGVGNNLLDPDGTATRAQFAAILYRFCTLYDL